MPAIKWSDSLLVGIREIDKQHHDLTNLINELHDAYTQGKDKEILLDFMSRINDCIRDHFLVEQDIMEEYDYPYIDDHMDEHNDFMLRALDHLKDCADDRDELAKDVLDYLVDWWEKHISGTDKRMGMFLKKNGLK